MCPSLFIGVSSLAPGESPASEATLMYMGKWPISDYDTVQERAHRYMYSYSTINETSIISQCRDMKAMNSSRFIYNLLICVIHFSKQDTA